MADIWMDVDTALAEVPVNILPLLDDTDFKTREESVAYDAAGMDLVWNFVTPGGAMSQTAVTPTSGGVHDWASQGNGMYSLEIPASGGTINNDTEGFGWFTGYATGVLPWRGPVIGFRAAGLNDKLIESAYSATRGLAGTALPDAAADAAGGLPVSDAGGLDLDAQIGTDIDAILVDTGTTLDGKLDMVDGIVDAILVDTGTDIPAAIAALNDLDAAGVRAAVGLAAANLDTQLGALPTAAENRAEMDANSTQLAAIVADTNELQMDDTPAALAALDAKIDTIDGIVDAILVDTGTTLDGKLDTVDGIVDAILVDTGTDIPAAIAALNDPSAADVADAVWDEAIADHAGAGSTGAALAAATAPSAADVADAVWDEALAGHLGAGSTGEALNAAGAAGDPWVTALPGAYGAGSAGNIVGNLNDLDAAGVRGAVGLAAADLDAQLGALPTAAENRAEMDANSTQLAAIVADTNELQTDDTPAALAALDAKIDTIDGIVDAILVDTGTTLDGKLDTVDGIVDAILVDTGTDIPAAIAALNDPSAADIADAVWDEALAGHLGAGSTGEALNAAGAAGDPWVTALPGAYGAGSAGNIVGNLNDLDAAGVRGAVGLAAADLDAQLAAIVADTDEVQAELADGGRTDLLIDAILADTNELQTDDTPAALAALDAKIDTVDGIVDAILVDTGTDIPAAIAALNDPSAADVADAVWDEAIAGHAGAGSTGAALAAATAPSAADVADAVWDEALAGHLGAGSTGEALNAAGAAGDPWITNLPGAYGAGSAGYILGNNLDEPVSDVAAEVWENPTRTLTQSAASVAAAVAGSQITVLRGDTLSASLTGLGALTGYVSLDFTVKRHKKATDAEAIIRIRLNATGVDDGLLRLNGAAAATPANGSITIDDMAAGDITIALEAAETKELLRGMYHYDVQVITATGVSTLTLGTAEVVEDVTRLVA